MNGWRYHESGKDCGVITFVVTPFLMPKKEHGIHGEGSCFFSPRKKKGAGMKPNATELYVIEQLINGKWYFFIAKDTEEHAESLAARLNSKTTEIFRVIKFTKERQPMNETT